MVVESRERLCRGEKKETDLTNVKIDELVRLVGAITSKVASDKAMPTTNIKKKKVAY